MLVIDTVECTAKDHLQLQSNDYSMLWIYQRMEMLQPKYLVFNLLFFFITLSKKAITRWWASSPLTTTVVLNLFIIEGYLVPLLIGGGPNLIELLF